MASRGTNYAASIRSYSRGQVVADGRVKYFEGGSESTACGVGRPPAVASDASRRGTRARLGVFGSRRAKSITAETSPISTVARPNPTGASSSPRRGRGGCHPTRRYWKAWTPPTSASYSAYAVAVRHLTSLSVRRFRAFEEFSISFGPTAVLVGPNNAGKSTIVSALRAVAQMVRMAKRLRANERIDVGDTYMWSHTFNTNYVGLEADGLRWESGSGSVTIRADFRNRCVLKATWPAEDDAGEPHFYLYKSDRRSVRDASEAKQLFPTIGVMPPVSPIERREEIRDARWVHDNIGGRLASRHFRNQLYRSNHNEIPEVDWVGWCDFCRTWLPEITISEPELAGPSLDVYYRDDLSAGWKEIVWAGDGFQVFLQLLFHLYRLRDADILVVDEPDIFLHADLQRRLMQAAQTVPAQLIVATHSTEVVTEIGAASMIWMDRTRRKAVRAPDDDVLDRISGALGSQFNLRLARVLRAKLALFVEGDDMRFLKHVARLIGASAFANETRLAVVPLEGGGNWRRLEWFAWMNDNFLGGAVHGVVLLDRDYHSDSYAESLISDLKATGIACHVWKHKELESYFLVPSTIARVSGAKLEEIEMFVTAISASMYEDVLFEYMTAFRQDYPDKRGWSDSKIGKELSWLRGLWQSPTDRLWRCPAKTVWSQLNGRLQDANYRAVSIERVVRSLRAAEVPDEMASFIRGINRRLTI
jgi:hypothetical protein